MACARLSIISCFLGKNGPSKVSPFFLTSFKSCLLFDLCLVEGFYCITTFGKFGGKAGIIEFASSTLGAGGKAGHKTTLFFTFSVNLGFVVYLD